MHQVSELEQRLRKEPIDFIYRWINPESGKDKLRRVLSNGDTPKLAQMSVINRYRDNGELKFSLRSVARHASWFHAIYIVGEGRPPAWLYLDDRINWVSTIGLQLSCKQKPQPNSETQKLYYSQIPGLADRFICFDDDWFFGDDVHESEFFSDAGTPIQPTIDSGYGEHSPIAWTRSLYDHALAALPRDFLTSVQNAGSTRPDPWISMRKLLADKGLVATSAERDAEVWLKNDNVHVYNDVFHDIRHTRPKCFCINDDWSLDDAEFKLQRSSLEAFLLGMYPITPPWERNEALQVGNAVRHDKAERWTAPFTASGTAVRVLRDGAATDVPVEHLRIGDQVFTSGDSPRVITWLCRHVIDCRQHPQALGPIRIAANALGAGRPARDLYLSPSQPIGVTIVDEFLVPVEALVNGATIARVAMEKMTYWQVGLDVHDVLLAENVPCESGWLAGDRVFFPGSTTPVLGAYRLGYESNQHCRPYHAVGMFTDAVRDRFIGRLKDVPGWYLARPPMSDVHLLLDGRRVEATVADLALRFAVPAGAKDVWLVSPASQPSVVAEGSSDTRALGLCLIRLVIDDGVGGPRTIPAADPRLTEGFHDAEEGVRRWTTGRAALPRALWEGVAGDFTLRLDLLVPLMPRWMAPTPKS